MEKSTQLQFLREEYEDLRRQYLLALTDGTSLQQIKDISLAIDSLAGEITLLEKQVAERVFVLTTPGETYGLFSER